MRVKRGVTARKRHKKLRKAAKGMQHSRTSSPRMARQAVNRAMQYQYRDRRTRKRDFRKLWITRINAAARSNGTNYSELIKNLNEANISLDRKILSELASTQPDAFTAVVKAASKTK